MSDCDDFFSIELYWSPTLLEQNQYDKLFKLGDFCSDIALILSSDIKRNLKRESFRVSVLSNISLLEYFYKAFMLLNNALSGSQQSPPRYLISKWYHQWVQEWNMIKTKLQSLWYYKWFKLWPLTVVFEKYKSLLFRQVFSTGIPNSLKHAITII